MTMDCVQHSPHMGSQYAMMYVLEHAVFGLDVAVMQDATLVSTYEYTQDPAVHIPVLISLGLDVGIEMCMVAVKQSHSQTWRPSSRLSLICVTPTNNIMSYN